MTTERAATSETSPVVDPLSQVSSEAQLAPGVEIGPFCRVGPGVILEEGVRLLSHVVLEGPTRIGARTVLHPFAALGGAPQHARHKGELTELLVGADCIIREHVSIHRGTAHSGGLTTLGDRVFVMAACHVGHDCRIGDDVILAGNASLAGHVEVGTGAIVGGLAGIHQFVRIGERAMIGGCAAVTGDVVPFATAFGNHAQLTGLNVVGLKRAGVPKDRLQRLRRGFLALFRDEGAPFRERLDAVERDYADSPEMMCIAEFIRAGENRPLLGLR